LIILTAPSLIAASRVLAMADALILNAPVRRVEWGWLWRACLAPLSVASSRSTPRR